MRRVGVALAIAALVLMSTPALGLAPSVSLNPNSGPAGTISGILLLGFTENAAYEVHAGGYDGPLLRSGTTDNAGNGINTVTIPPGTPPGPLTIAVCETSQGCTNTGNEFWRGATATFTVTGGETTTSSTSSTTTSSSSTTTTPLAAVPAETCVSFGDWGTGTAPLATPDDAIVMTFDEYGSASYEAPHALDSAGRVDVSTAPRVEDGGIGFYFGAFGHATTTLGASGRRVIALDGEYTGIATTIRPSPAPGTVSPPNVASSDGINGQTFSILGDYEIAYVGMHFGGYEAFDADFDVTFSVTVNHLPARLEDGTIVTAELGSGALTLTIGPEDIPVNRCVVIALDFTEWRAAGGEAFERLEPAAGAVVDVHTEITRGGAGLGGPADMPMYIDDVFFAVLEEAEATATTTTLTGPTTTAAAAAPADDDDSGAPVFLLIGGAALLGLLGGWALFRPRSPRPR